MQHGDVAYEVALVHSGENLFGLFALLKSLGGTQIVGSHDLDMILDLCQRESRVVEKHAAGSGQIDPASAAGH